MISPVSCRFCDLCNRLRLTADGYLRPCLTSEGQVDLRPALRPHLRREVITDSFHVATAGRPLHGTYHHSDDRPAGARPMAAIGG